MASSIVSELQHAPMADNVGQQQVSAVLLAGLTAEERERIVSSGQWQNISQGQYVYRQGEISGRFYIIVNGEVELIYNAGSPSQLSVGHIGSGGHFGETSLLTDSSNSLSVLAKTDLILLTFDREAFNSSLLSSPVIQTRLLTSLAKRLRVSFQDHVNSLTKWKNHRQSVDHLLDSSFLAPLRSAGGAEEPVSGIARESRLAESTIHRQITRAVQRFSANTEPLLITGEAGSGRRMVAGEIHGGGICSKGPYTEVDIRAIDSLQMEMELFGYGSHGLPFPQADRLGILEQMPGGTVVLYNAEHLEPDIQRQLATVIRKKTFTRVDGETEIPLRARIILICKDEPRQQDGHNRLLPQLYTLFARQHLRVAPLRDHRRDIPRLIQYYLRRYSLQYGKNIRKIDNQTLGKLINYDWPGNLTELAGVLQRAVVLGKSNEPLTDEILLGVPRSEGKWEYNLLRIRAIRTVVTSRFFPVLPRALVGIFFLFVVGVLFFGPSSAHHNIGLTLSWVIGWPMMIFAFFFLARTWCSVCGLSVPGWLAQKIIRPSRPTPKIIRQYSAWIMATLCIVLFWIETTWNAYASPRLTAWIIFTITMGSFICSLIFKRRVWCRYICPLGAVNALFSMPSILELRANSHMCLNRCHNHACYTGDEDQTGCPMFRHPFLVDNNRDCILCGQCIKNCTLHSLHLNLRLAPQELWNQQNPRLADSLLVVSLAAIFFPFVFNQHSPDFLARAGEVFRQHGVASSPALLSSLFFFTVVAFYICGYGTLSFIIARITANSWKTAAAILGYGMIPLVLGAFMSVHLDILVRDLWLLPANIMELAGIGGTYRPVRALSQDVTFLLQVVTVCGGLAASLYATRRIVSRLAVGRRFQPAMAGLPAILLCLSAVAYLVCM